MWEKVIVATLTSSFAVILFLKKWFGGVYCNCKNQLDDKVIIITGASSGIGRETAIILAKYGAKVILGCRCEEESQRIASAVSEITGNACVKYERLDVSSFESIIDFVNRFKGTGCNLFGLVNNAGIFYIPIQLTKDGFDKTIQTNFYGPFLLSYLLLDTLKDSSPSRIVNVGSESHWYPKELDISILQHHFKLNKNFDKFMIYGISKLCLMLITAKLAKELNGCNVAVNSINPGNVRTNIYRCFPAIKSVPLISFSGLLLWLTFKTPYQGAQTIKHLLINEKLQNTSGKYFSDCTEKKCSDLVTSTALQDKLWEFTLRLLHPFIYHNEKVVF